MSTRSKSVPVPAGGGAATVPLAVLLRREVVSEKTAAERPELQVGLFSQAKKGEDYTFLKPDCERLPGVPSSSFSAFGLFDGHNGNGAAIYTKENLLSNILTAIPADLNREDWLAALPRAMVAAFVKTDKDFQTKARSSGTTVTFVIIDGLFITVASVGDSRCVLEAEGSIYHLSADHRFDASKEE
jgi:serine/threonine protein phosphatase PrpC